MSTWRQLRGDGAFELRFGGGLNERDDYSINLEECVDGENFLLDATARTLRPRPPQDLEGTAPNAGEITGILQLIKRNDTVTQVLVAADKWYDWDGASIYSDVTPPIFTTGGRMRGNYWSLDDILVITNLDLSCPLYKWNGSDVTRLKTTLTSGTTQAISANNLACSGGVVTVTLTTHGYSEGDLVTIAGANEGNYNGEWEIASVPTADTFTYSITGSCGVTPDASASMTSDKSPEIKAKYSVVHNHRVWLFNIKADSSETPHMILVSAYEDAEDYDNATRGTAQGGTATANDAFFILSPDGRPINGAVEFFDVIIFSTDEGKLFKIVGDDAENYSVDEFYPGSSAQGEEAIVNIGNDVVYFRRGKSVESLSSTDRFGDVTTDDLSFWIPTSVESLCSPIAVYDSEKQRVYFFCDDLGGVLVLDKAMLLSGKQGDKDRLSPWTSYTTTMANEFSTKCAVEIRDPLSTSKQKTVFWGDDAGQVFNMNGTAGAGDAGSASINVVRKTKVITELDTNNELMVGRVEYVRTSNVTLEMVFNWGDEYHREAVRIPLKASFGLGGANFFGGDLYWNDGVGDLPDLSTSKFWNTGRVVGDQLSSMGFSAPGKGSGFIVEFQVSGVDDYEISRIVV